MKYYTEEDIRKAFQAGMNKGALKGYQSYYDAPLDENEFVDELNEDGYQRRLLSRADGSIKEALVLLAGSTNKRDKEIIKLLRSALKDLYQK